MIRLAHDFIDPVAFKDTGYVGIESLMNVELIGDYDEIPEALSRLGYVHHVRHPIRSKVGNSKWGGEYQGPLVKEAAVKISDFKSRWTSASMVLGGEVLFAFRDHRAAVMFKMLINP